MVDNKVIDGKLISSEIREKIKIFGEELKKKIRKNSWISSCSCWRKSS